MKFLILPYSIVFLLSVVIVLLYLRNRHLSKSNRQLLNNYKSVLLKSKTFSSQMNPHFVYNSLSAAQYLIMINENKNAFDYLSDFSLLLREMFENAKKSFVDLKDEVSFLRRYIELEKRRFNNSFMYFINLKNLDETKIYCVPAMIFQPIVENAIRHGLAPKKQNGKLKINFYVTGAKLICTIDDNGIGFKKKSADYIYNANKTLSIINERVKLAGEKSKIKSYLRVIDKKEKGSEGVLVEIALPIENN